MTAHVARLSPLAWILAATVSLCSVAQAQTEAGETTPGEVQAAPAPETSPPESAANPKPRSVLRAGPSQAVEPIDLEQMTIARKRRISLYPVNSRISRYLNAAMETQEEGDPAEGLALIARLNPKRLNPMERASVFRVEALLHYAAGKMDATIAGFRKVLDEEILPLTQETALRFNIAQLFAGLYRWNEAIEALDDWFRYVEQPKPIAYYLLGIANFQLGNPDLAIVNTEKALELAPKPKEAWLQLLAALYIQQEDYANATPILEELVVRFPKKAYWVQLGLIYGARENYRGSLAIRQIAYAQGLLTEDKELRRLARSYLYSELPYPAARVLEKGIADDKIKKDAKALELLANSWIAAREFDKSLPPLRQAAAVAEDGNLYLRLGQVYLQREAWDLAAERFEDAIKKGNLEDPGNAKLLLGIAYYNDTQVFRARSSFIEAADYDKTRVAAERWISHLEREAKSSPAAAGGQG